jgi:5'-3' exonuclease
VSSAPVVHLVDAYVYVFRSYFSMPPMHAPDGTPVQAAHGFAATLLRMFGELAPTHFACAFDFAMTSFRNELFAEYKAGRTEAPPDLEPQFEICEAITRALGIPVLVAEGFEADDLIATAADAVVANGGDVLVLSADKDLTQLVREDGRVAMLDFARAKRFDANGVRERFGVAPAQIPDYLALVGDAVDNLPGVPGIGPRTAAQLLVAFGSLEAIPPQGEAWRGVGIRGGIGLAERFVAGRDRALQVRELARLRRDAPGATLPLDAFAWRGPDPALAADLFGRLGWNGLARRVAALATNQGPEADTCR